MKSTQTMGATSTVHDTSMLLALTAVGVIWLRSSLGKITSGEFVTSFGQTANSLAANNPYSFVKEIVVTKVMPNAEFWGMVIMGTELLVACILTLGTLYLLFMKGNRALITMILGCGLLIGIFLNLAFWLAAGHTSTATDSLNLLMIVIQVAGLLHLSKQVS